MLNYINNVLSPVINYQFGTWTTNNVPDPFFVGEYTQSESITLEEDGYQESTFLLTGTGTSWIELEKAKKRVLSAIEENNRAILPDGGIAIFYAGSHIIPTGDAELKRIQINIKIKEWKVK